MAIISATQPGLLIPTNQETSDFIQLASGRGRHEADVSVGSDDDIPPRPNENRLLRVNKAAYFNQPLIYQHARFAAQFDDDFKIRSTHCDRGYWAEDSIRIGALALMVDRGANSSYRNHEQVTPGTSRLEVF